MLLFLFIRIPVKVVAFYYKMGARVLKGDKIFLPIYFRMHEQSIGGGLQTAAQL
jgi:hypothetical protein